MSRTDETRHIKWHETCKYKCRLDASVCNNKQRWNNDKYGCKCKQLIDKGICDNGSTRNPSNCECECDKSCDIGEFSGYENYKYRIKVVDRLVVECTENIEIISTDFHSAGHENVCVCSYTVCVILAVIALAISIGVGAHFAYARWYLKKDVNLAHVLNGIAHKQQFNEHINGKSQ